MVNFSYFNPVNVVFGIHSLSKLEEYVKSLTQNKEVLIITDKGLLDLLGIKIYLENLFNQLGISLSIYEKPDPISSIEVVHDCITFAKHHHFGLIIGIGGGSVLDTVKCTAVFIQHSISLNSYLHSPISFSSPKIPFIAIPTTAGTGSEVTKWATIWDVGTHKKKYSISDDYLYATAALVDPELTLNLPRQLTISTGLDALSQAMEAYWSRNHNAISDMYALHAIPLLVNNLEQVVLNPRDLHLREQMMLGSLLSGLAFSNTKTTVVHSVSYPLTLYHNIPHGLACALTLPSFMRFNAVSTPENLPESPSRLQHIASLLNVGSVERAAELIQDIMIRLEVPIRLSQWGISASDLDRIIDESITPDRAGHNPRPVSKSDVRKILQDLL